MKIANIAFIVVSVLLLGRIGMTDEHLSSKLFIVNRIEPGGDILLTAKINITNKNVNIDYNPGGDNRTAQIKIGLLKKGNIKLLTTATLKCTNFSDPKQNYQSTIINVPNIERGTIIIWVDKITAKDINVTTPLSNAYILNAVKVILSEQTRLSFIGAYKGEKELLNEVGRNYEE